MVNLRDFPFIVHCFGWFHFTAPKQPVSSHLSWFPIGLFVGGLQHQLHCSTQRWCSGFNLCNWSNQWSPSSCGATGLLRMRRRLVFLRVDGSKGFLKDHPKNVCLFLNPQKSSGFSCQRTSVQVDWDDISILTKIKHQMQPSDYDDFALNDRSPISSS